MKKNKPLAAWLAFRGGPLGLHRFYLHGFADPLGWLLPIPSILGWYGVQRVQQFGVDDHWSWVLIPLLGFTIAGCGLTAIIYSLMTPETWNARCNTEADSGTPAHRPRLLPICTLASSVQVGTHGLVGQVTCNFTPA